MIDSNQPGTMPLIIQRTGNWESLEAAITEMAATPGVTGILALACEAHGEAPTRFDERLRSLSVPTFGGVFPGLIANADHLEHGNIVLGLTAPLDVYVVPSLSDASLDFDAWLSATIPPGGMSDAKTMFVLVDGLAPRVGALIESLFNTFGLQGNFVGGGAGSLSVANLRCLITPHGVVRDAAVLAIPTLRSHVSVAHGWLPIAGPFEVTSSEDNIIQTLDWQPAIDVYRRVVEAQTGAAFDFAAVAHAYPFGIARLNKEFVVRDPIKVGPDGSLMCVGDVARGSLIHIMNGNRSSLLTAASQVRQMADAKTSEGSRQAVDIVMDCISRARFLGETIGQEIDALRNPARPLIGAFSLGEIANSGQEYLEFHNKTAVVSTIWR